MQESISLRRYRNFTDSLPAFVFDPSLDAKKRSKLIEKEMNEQAKIINDLRSLGASHGTIEQEMKRLQELEAMVFKDFRRYGGIRDCAEFSLLCFPLKPNDLKKRHTAQLTSRCCILYIYSTNIRTEYFKHAA